MSSLRGFATKLRANIAASQELLDAAYIHLVWGILALVAFAVSGQVMLTHVPPMRPPSDDVRLSAG